MEGKRQPKISLPEIILIGLFFVILDAIDLIPFAGDLDDVFAAPLGAYYLIKGINGIAFWVSWLLKLIPGFQELPLRTLSWAITVGIDRFAPSKLVQITEQAGELGEGGIGEEEATEKTLENARTAEQLKEGEQAGQTAAEGEKIKGKPSEEKQENRNRRGDDQNETGQEDENSNQGPQDEEDELKRDAEIDPEEEAEDQDFSAPHPSYVNTNEEDDDEDEEEKRPKVIDISSRQKKAPPKRSNKDTDRSAA
jgi:hypothetical protein